MHTHTRTHAHARTCVHDIMNNKHTHTRSRSNNNNKGNVRTEGQSLDRTGRQCLATLRSVATSRLGVANLFTQSFHRIGTEAHSDNSVQSLPPPFLPPPSPRVSTLAGTEEWIFVNSRRTLHSVHTAMTLCYEIHANHRASFR